MAEILSLREAVATLVRDGETVALEGFTHLISARRRARADPAATVRVGARPHDPGCDLRPADRRRVRSPADLLDAVAVTPGGAHPSYAHGYYDRDNDFYVRWDEISRDRERFTAWTERHILGTEDVDEYHRSLEGAGVAA